MIETIKSIRSEKDGKEILKRIKTVMDSPAIQEVMNDASPDK